MLDYLIALALLKKLLFFAMPATRKIGLKMIKSARGFSLVQKNVLGWMDG
jgi:hypothetical protein